MVFWRISRVILWGLLILAQVDGALAGRVKDQAGRQVDLPDAPGRVVSLAPSLTEMVWSLGRQDVLSGASTHSDFPPEADRLPKVGPYSMPDLEAILALGPDLCLAIRDGTPLAVVEALSRLGVAVYVLDIRSVRGVFEAMLALGEILGAPERARKEVDLLKARLAKISTGLPPGKRPGVFYQIGQNPMITAGNDTVINGIIELAGGRNVACGLSGYPRMDLEAVVALAPEAVAIPGMGGLEGRETAQAWQAFPMVPAVASGKIFVVDSDLFDRPGPRVVRAVEELHGLLYLEKARAR